MSNLLKDASILLTPTGYDNGSMNAIKPTDGDGDFTFVRGSAATRVNAQGLVENVQIIGGELVTNGDFSNGSTDWNIEAVWTIGDGVANGNGANGTSEELSQSNVVTIGKTYSISYEVKNYVSGIIRLRKPQTINRNANGTYTEIVTATAASFIFNPSNFNGSITNISVKEIIDDTNIPRINYEGFSFQDTLGSEEITNGDFSNGDTDWNREAGVFTISDGVANGNGANGGSEELSQNLGQDLTAGKTYKIVFKLLNYVSGSVQFALTGGSSFFGTSQSADGTFTQYVVALGDNDKIKFRGANFNGSITNISVKELLSQEVIPNSGCGSWLLEPQSTNLYLNSETLVTQSNATSASTYTVSFYGSGSITFSGTHIGSLVGSGTVERVSVTFTATSGTLTSTIIGNVNKGQLEEQSFATSYIPTEGATNTRNQDIATDSGNATLINSIEGTLYAEMSALANENGQKILSISDGTSNNTVKLGIAGNTLSGLKFFADIRVGGVTQAFLNENFGDLAPTFKKCAIKYKENDFALWVDGVEVATDTSGSTFSANTLNVLKFTRGDAGQKFFGKNKALAVYKEALTDAELQCLTTP